MQFSRPILVVIGGPNGSGKTTLASYLIEKRRITTTIINPDEIAFKELGSYQNQFKAARVALDRRKAALEKNESFAFETTFSGNSELRDIKAAKQQGYLVVLYYVALQSVIDNLTRVQERQTNFGHNVDSGDIIRRYHHSQSNLISHINIFDSVYLFDNSQSLRSRVAIFSEGKVAWINRKHVNHPFYAGILSTP